MSDLGRYSCRTLNGNWFEDQVAEEEKIRQFLEKKAAGTLTIQRIRQSAGEVHMDPVGTSVNADGLLHSGQKIRILNGEHGAYVAADPGDAISVEEGMFSATGSQLAEASARNVWIIEKDEEDGDDIVRYGDGIYIKTTSAIGGDYYLGSVLADWSHFSRIARKQPVFVTAAKSWKCLWKIVDTSRETAVEMEGESVPVGATVFLKHNSTNSPLACRSSRVLNDYGSELELVAAREPGRQMIWKLVVE